VAQIEPPPRLRRRLIATVRKEARRARAGSEPRRSPLPALVWRPATAAAAGVLLVAGAVAGYLVHEPGGSSGTSSVTTQRQAPGSKLAATLEQSGGTAVLRMADVPRLPKGEVYEAWVKRGPAVEPSSLFLPGPGHAVAAAV